MTHKIRGVDVRKIRTLCQQTFPKRWFGNVTMASNCDVINSAHQIQMATICHWMKPPPWKFSAYATDGDYTSFRVRFVHPSTSAHHSCLSLQTFMFYTMKLFQKRLIQEVLQRYTIQTVSLLPLNYYETIYTLWLERRNSRIMASFHRFSNK